MTEKNKEKEQVKKAKTPKMKEQEISPEASQETEGKDSSSGIKVVKVAGKIAFAPIKFIFKQYLVKYTSADREYRPGRLTQYIVEGMSSRRQAINKCKREIETHSQDLPTTLKGFRRRFLSNPENTEEDRKYRHLQGKFLMFAILFMYLFIVSWYFRNVYGTHLSVVETVTFDFMAYSLAVPALALYLKGGYVSFCARNKMYLTWPKYLKEVVSRPFTELLPFATYEDVKYGDRIQGAKK